MVTDAIVVTDREPMAELAELWRSCVETYQLMAGTVVPDSRASTVSTTSNVCID